MLYLPDTQPTQPLTTTACQPFSAVATHSKVSPFLAAVMRLYCVPEEKQEQVIARVLQMDLRTQAQEIVGEAVRRAEAGFEAVMADTGQA